MNAIHTLFALFCSFALLGQVTTIPQNVTTSDTVTIIYDATQGNGALAGFNGSVYAHTGLITANSNGPNDWKFIASNWGTADSSVLMTPLGNDKYSLTFRIDSFYGVPDSEIVYDLAFVFRNDNGSIVGRSASNNDIFYPINRIFPGELVSYSQIGNELILNLDTGKMYIMAYNNQTIRVSASVDGNQPVDSTLMMPNLPQNIALTVIDNPNELVYSTSAIDLVIQKNPVRLKYVQNGDTVFSEDPGFFIHYDRKGLSFGISPTEEIYGGGWRAIDMNLRGEKLEIYNQAHYGYSAGARNCNITIPFFVSSNGYGLYVNNAHPAMVDVAQTNPEQLTYSMEGGEISYFFVGGNNLDGVMENYGHLTGFQTMPPIWSLGFIQSRYGYETESEARNIVTQMQNANFPLDALILDLYWFGDPSTMGNLDWDLNRFPTPTKMISDFRNDGVKTVLITETYFTQQSTNFNTLANNGLLATTQGGAPYVIGGFWAGSSGLLDVTQKPAMDWFWNQYDPLIQQGIEGWWCDLGEPENHPWDMVHSGGSAREVHNSYSLIWAKMLHEKYQQHYPNKRLFNLIRSGYAGMQRFGSIPWSGDIQRSFDGLRIQVPIMLGGGLSGTPYIHSDLGGFVGGGQDDELYTRWLQLGVFSPIMRAHGTGVPTEPIFYTTQTQNIVREAIRLRYKMLPYNYNLAYKASTNGRPFVLPMNYFEPNNPNLQNINDQFFWGEEILVAPVFTQGQTSRAVYFPSGVWIDPENDNTYQGNASQNVNAPIEKIPYFIKAGSFIPMTPLVSTTDDYSSEHLVIKYFPDQSELQTSYEFFLDDGNATNTIASNNYEIIDLYGDFDPGNTIEIDLDKSGTYTGAPSLRTMEFQIHRIDSAPSKVFQDGTELTLRATLGDFNNMPDGYRYNAQQKRLYVKTEWFGNAETITIQFKGGTPPPPPSFVNNIEPFNFHQPFPNPAVNEVNLVWDSNHESPTQLFISDLTGKVIYERNLETSVNRNNLNLNFSAEGLNVSSGVYFVELRGNTFAKKHKMLVQ